jgi:hypothetical protein
MSAFRVEQYSGNIRAEIAQHKEDGHDEDICGDHRKIPVERRVQCVGPDPRKGKYGFDHGGSGNQITDMLPEQGVKTPDWGRDRRRNIANMRAEDICSYFLWIAVRSN